MVTRMGALEQQLWDFVSAYDAAFDRASEDNGLSAAQACTLTPLTGDRHTMSELAELLLCDASNVTQIVGRLEARGLVSRTPDPADRRVKQVAITPDGRRLRRAVAKSFTFPRERVARLDDEEQEQLGHLLAKMLS
ncbi:MarR family winged helix-turn-helix transcriptional regulator [Amycolatopsis sp. CA-230715]|uniref:MarR family winged helix-turn-helix transcriptional regulator n=1 Tax=Amycolatopsis sp. CA-230715 TaxID=2745196 RepID=UPI001C025285|nr:MarR family transcriptional regulator [Amycolatopsis sp. CA-230715]QWF83808.1 hypothetical protein HUW46_07251 [Amycolatopsis sp. CA-230715]